jgi:hypothetical protein
MLYMQEALAKEKARFEALEAGLRHEVRSLTLMKVKKFDLKIGEVFDFKIGKVFD